MLSVSFRFIVFEFRFVAVAVNKCISFRWCPDIRSVWHLVERRLQLNFGATVSRDSLLLAYFFHLPHSTQFPTAGLSTSYVCADWLHDWSSAAKWARLLIPYLVAALSNTHKIQAQWELLAYGLSTEAEATPQVLVETTLWPRIL